MRRAYRIALVGLLVVATLAQSPLVAVADEGSAFLMESEVLLTVAMDPDVAAESLLVQGTSWPGDPFSCRARRGRATRISTYSRWSTIRRGE